MKTGLWIGIQIKWSMAMVLKIFSYSPYTNPNTVKSSPTKIAKDNCKNFHTTWNGSTSRCLL